MNMTRWRNRQRNGGSELAPVSRLRGEMENLFDRFLGDPWSALTGRESWLSPPMDIAETEEEVSLRVELPGVKPEDIQIDVIGDLLTLRGEKTEQKDEKGSDYHYCESEYGCFSRTVQLPSGVDPDNVQATYKNGILMIKLTKRPDAKPKRIPVQGATGAQSVGREMSAQSQSQRKNSPGGASTRPAGSKWPQEHEEKTR